MTSTIGSGIGPRGAALARALRARLELDVALVEETLPQEDRRDAAIRAAARYLDATAPSRIAVGWGMSLRRLPDAVPRRPRESVQVYDAIGAGAWWAPEDGPFDIAAGLAARYGGRAWHVPAPVFAASNEAARALLALPDVRAARSETSSASSTTRAGGRSAPSSMRGPYGCPSDSCAPPTSSRSPRGPNGSPRSSEPIAAGSSRDSSPTPEHARSSSRRSARKADDTRYPQDRHFY
ncbi:MAG: hypothetical protein E6J27_06825 [Chloroflexi bacterium]|nr:MAG: hypothetical protein E6J27_06825 [Chloroflexota bacterium]